MPFSAKWNFHIKILLKMSYSPRHEINYMLESKTYNPHSWRRQRFMNWQCNAKYIPCLLLIFPSSYFCFLYLFLCHFILIAFLPVLFIFLFSPFIFFLFCAFIPVINMLLVRHQSIQTTRGIFGLRTISNTLHIVCLDFFSSKDINPLNCNVS